MELSFPRLIVVPLSSQEVDGVRKEKERLTTALTLRLAPMSLPHSLTVGSWLEKESAGLGQEEEEQTFHLLYLSDPKALS
jgi:hypothetical protein